MKGRYEALRARMAILRLGLARAWRTFWQDAKRRCPACGSRRGPWVVELDRTTGSFLQPYCWDCHATGVLARTALREPAPANYYLNDAQYTQKLGEIFAGLRPVEEEP